MKPITAPIKRFKFSAYDLEWDPTTLGLRLFGVYDERGSRAYTCVDDFLKFELTARNNGRVFFAHAGGRFDVQFILRRLLALGYWAVGAMSGSSIVRLSVHKGNNRWIFGDSFLLLKSGLGKVGDSIGLPKGECDFSAPLTQLSAYNQRDCEIVYYGILRLREILERAGGELRYTLSACAMALFRRRFLKREIQTSSILNATLRPGYYASRVENRATRGPPRGTLARVYDINSSFAWSMTRPLPGDLIGDSKRKGALGIHRVTVRVPQGDLPPLPRRGPNGGIYFPWGDWEGLYNDLDLETLDEYGGSFKIHSSYYFEPFDDFADYISFCFEGKEGARIAGDDFLYEAFKLLANGAYGKLAEGEEKTAIHVNPRELFRTDVSIFPGIVARDSVESVDTAHLPASIWITASSRALLWRLSSACPSGSYYNDTDSIHTVDPLPTSDALGALKVQDTFDEAHYAACKLYAYHTPTLDAPCAYCLKAKPPHTGPCPGHDIVKSKGFRRLTRPAYDSLVSGGSVSVGTGFHGVLTTGGLDEDSRPTEQYRSLRRWLVCSVCWSRSYVGCEIHGEGKSFVESNSIPKRKELGPKGSIAWHVSELGEKRSIEPPEEIEIG